MTHYRKDGKHLMYGGHWGRSPACCCPDPLLCLRHPCYTNVSQCFDWDVPQDYGNCTLLLDHWQALQWDATLPSGFTGTAADCAACLDNQTITLSYWAFGFTTPMWRAAMSCPGPGPTPTQIEILFYPQCLGIDGPIFWSLDMNSVVSGTGSHSQWQRYVPNGTRMNCEVAMTLDGGPAGLDPGATIYCTAPVSSVLVSPH